MSTEQSAPAGPPSAPGESIGPVTAEVRALLGRLDAAPVGEHAPVFADIHGVLQNALSDAGRDSAAR